MPRLAAPGLLPHAASDARLRLWPALRTRYSIREARASASGSTRCCRQPAPKSPIRTFRHPGQGDEEGQRKEHVAEKAVEVGSARRRARGGRGGLAYAFRTGVQHTNGGGVVCPKKNKKKKDFPVMRLAFSNIPENDWLDEE